MEGESFNTFTLLLRDHRLLTQRDLLLSFLHNSSSSVTVYEAFGFFYDLEKRSPLVLQPSSFFFLLFSFAPNYPCSFQHFAFSFFLVQYFDGIHLLTHRCESLTCSSYLYLTFPPCVSGSAATNACNCDGS